MCGRAVLARPHAIREWFDVETTPAGDELEPRYNIAPSQVMAVIRTPRRLELLPWGIVRAPKTAPQIVARVESIARTANRQRRCLVVVDGFYEWKKSADRKVKQPYLLREADGRPFALGGIWSRRTTDDGEIVESVAVLTCAPLPPVASIHDRMPLILPPDGYARWLDHGADVTDLLRPNASALVATAVSTYVSSTKNDGPMCIEPISEPAA
jgi:putative SOS response-associated peptidase YedK